MMIGTFASARRVMSLLAWAFAIGIGVASLATPAAYGQKVPEGFAAELIYQPPDVEHPSVVTCDPAGNLYVGEDPMDMRGPTKSEFDRVLLLKFDPQTGKPTRTVYCEKLAAVFGLVWHEGWLYVMHAPHYSRFRDADGDGVAEVREDLATGFGPPAGIYGFNDHIVTGTRMGLDGWIYVSVGDKGIPKAVGKDQSTITLEGGGVVRMRPDGTRLEVFSSGTRNHLDVAMDSLDNIFTYDNTDDGLGWWTRFTHHVQTGYYGYPYDYLTRPERHLPRIAEFGGGSPVGAACYCEAAWPQKYRDAAFHCEWGKRKIQVFYPKPSGATFTAEMEDFMIPEAGSEFRPQDLCFSPDGKWMYVADWNFGGWVKPDVVGRLYRVRYTGTDVPAEPARATDADPLPKQLISLGHPARSERERAQHKLIRDGQASIAPVTALLADGKSPKLARVHAIWTLYGLFEAAQGYDPQPAYIEALQSAEPDVRAQAARALGLIRSRTATVAFVAALRDADPKVRLQAAVALGYLGDKAAAPALFQALTESDPFARFAMVQALRSINDWAAATGTLVDSPDANARAAARLALTGVYDVKAVEVLAQAALSAMKLPIEERVSAFETLTEVHLQADPYVTGWWGTRPAANPPKRPKKNAWDGTPVVAAAIGAGLTSPEARLRSAAARAIRLAPSDPHRTRLRTLATDDPEEAVRLAAIETLGEWRDEPANDFLSKLAVDRTSSDALRLAAVKAMTSIGSKSSIGKLVEIAKASDSSADLVALALDALGKLKDPQAAEIAESRLADARADVRVRAIAALAATRGAAAAKSITPLLKDRDMAVKQAAIAALESLKSKDAVPELIAAAADPELRQPIQIVLGAIPDARALGLYLEGLASKNSEVRDACRSALVAVRDEIGGDVIQLHERNELTAPARAGLQQVFSTPVPMLKWLAVGPFPKSEPQPEFDYAASPDKGAKFAAAKKTVAWQEITSSDPNGRFIGDRLFRPADGVWVYLHGTIEVETAQASPFIIGSDDQMTLWVNGKQVYEFKGNRGYNANQDTVQVQLQPGVNQIWAKVGNDGGPFEFGVRSGRRDPRFAFLFDSVAPKLDASKYAEFAKRHPGNAERGKRIFDDVKGVGCAKCHVVDGQGGKVGPDLTGVGVKYPREELIRSTLEPSNRILHGYEMHSITTIDGRIVQGLLKNETAAGLEIVLADGKLIAVPKDDIDERLMSKVSLMPNGLKDGMTLEEFADLMAYLESLKQPPTKP